MVESSTYMDSVAKGELVPQITLNRLANGEEWTLYEMSELMSRATNQSIPASAPLAWNRYYS